MSYIMSGLGWILKNCCILFGNYGLGIILFTILIKAVLLPLTVKQQKSMMKTQKIQPLLNELQRKYGNDKEKLNSETMKLYQKYNINPMGGCLPMLIQLPILMMLYWVVRRPIVYIMGFGEDEVWRIVSAVVEWAEGDPARMTEFLNSITLNGKAIESIEELTRDAYKNFGAYEIQIARFLNSHPEVMDSHWITELGRTFTPISFNFLTMDLSQTPELSSVLKLFNGKLNELDASTVALWTIPILSGVSAFLSSKVSQSLNPQQQPKVESDGSIKSNPMKSMTIMMPLISVWFAFTLPAAIGLYWIISNILAIVQQVILTKVLDTNITEEQIEGEIIDAKKSRKKRKK